MNKFNSNPNVMIQHKFGAISVQHSFNMLKKQKSNSDATFIPINIKQNHVEKLQPVLKEIIDKYTVVIENTTHEPNVDITEIYKTKAEETINNVETKNIKMPKFRAVVELAISKAKLDALINKKKW